MRTAVNGRQASTYRRGDEEIDITVLAEGVRVNQAAVIATDIEASNGIIHVIHEVILPPAS